jgi:hypothetical protein
MLTADWTPGSARLRSFTVTALKHGLELRLQSSCESWVMTLPIGGFAFDWVQYQVRSDDAPGSLLMELRAEGDTYRGLVDSLEGITGEIVDHGPHWANVNRVVSELLAPVASLHGSLDSPSDHLATLARRPTRNASPLLRGL